MRYCAPLRRPPRLPPSGGSEDRDPSPRWASRVAPCSMSTCHAHYPGERPRHRRSVTPTRSSGLPCFEGRSALTIFFRGLLGLHSRCGPSTRRPTLGGPLSRELQRVGCPPRRLGSYRGEPTTPQAGLTPARTQHLSTAHLKKVQMRGGEGDGTPRRSSHSALASWLRLSARIATYVERVPPPSPTKQMGLFQQPRGAS